MSEFETEYNDVSTRRAQFFHRFPQGSIGPADPAVPYRIELMPNGTTFVAYVAAAHRYPGDPTPGIGTAWEPFPGKTDITLDSELQNAETSAWGRAMAAVGIATHRISTVEDVQRRQADREAERSAVKVAAVPEPPKQPTSADRRKILAAAKKLGIDEGALPGLFEQVFATSYESVSAVDLAEFHSRLPELAKESAPDEVAS
jgi:hypothetical protein